MSTNTTRPALKIEWQRTAGGNYQTRTVDPRNGKTYLSVPVPLAFALRLGMPTAIAERKDA